jgi:hypothetical protein
MSKLANTTNLRDAYPIGALEAFLYKKAAAVELLAAPPLPLRAFAGGISEMT